MAKKKDQGEQKGKRSKGEASSDRRGQAPKADKRAKRAKGERNAGSGQAAPRLESRLLSHYREQAVPRLIEQFGWKNRHQVPRIEKVVVNCGLGESTKNQKLLDSVVKELRLIVGQKPVVTRARKSIANFNLREGMPIGVAVTLRKERMYHFLDRLVSVAIPRIRDFRGLVTRSFDGRGNYTLGIKEQIIFPEVDYDRVQEIHGLDVTVVTSTNKDDEAFALLREMGFPFRGENPVIIGQAAA